MPIGTVWQPRSDADLGGPDIPAGPPTLTHPSSSPTSTSPPRIDPPTQHCTRHDADASRPRSRLCKMNDVYDMVWHAMEQNAIDCHDTHTNGAEACTEAISSTCRTGCLPIAALFLEAVLLLLAA